MGQRGKRKKKRGVVYKGGVGKRSGYEVVVVVVVGGWRWGGVVYKGQRGRERFIR